MQLHRSEQAADWLSVSPENRNNWQKVAARTHSVVTPGNVISIVGLLMAGAGFWLIVAEQYWAGLGLLFVGRLLDLADGLAADKTGTKCRLGERIDATTDKLLTVTALLLLPATGVMPWWAAMSLLVVHVIIAVVIVISNLQNRLTHSSVWGKYSMAATWSCLPLFILTAALSGNTICNVLSYAALAMALCLAVIAFIDYVRQYAKSATT